MYKILIVDDEPLSVIGIRSMIESIDLDLQVTGTAGNGEEALAVMKKDMPDIVLTDIKMPVMDGLTYIKTCRELYGEKKPVFIILTSYEEFWMAKQAITYNAMEYLVKVEMSEEVLKKTLEKAVEAIGLMNDKADNAGMTDSSFMYRMHDKFMISLLHDLFESEEQFRLQAQDLGLDFSHEKYLCCYGELLSPQHSSLSYAQHTSLFSGCIQMILNLLERSFQCHVITLDNSHVAISIFGPENLPDPL